MCGRASQHSDPTEIEHRFRLPPNAPRINLPPARWNAAPRQELAIVRRDAAARCIVDIARWRLVPPWAKDISIGDRAINACDIGEDGRSLDSKPMFRDAWKLGRRCLVPLNSFFEWRKLCKQRLPVAIALTDGEQLGVASLWESWHGHDCQSSARSPSSRRRPTICWRPPTIACPSSSMPPITIDGWMGRRPTPKSYCGRIRARACGAGM